MPQKPLLSVAIIVQNHRDVVESTLTSLYELSTIPFELFIIDDASTDGSNEVIQSVVDYYQHEHTFYFSHEQVDGRGNSLNEVLVQCSGNFFWAPETITDISEETLSQRLEQLTDSDHAMLLQQRQLPSTHQQWIDYLDRHNWPLDGSFIWNLSAFASGNQFFNPYLKQHHGVELAIRLGDDSSIVSENPWYQPSNFVQAPEPDLQLRQEVLFSLLRRTGESDRTRSKIINELKNLSLPADQEFEHELLNDAVRMKQDGRFNSALELIEDVLKEKPDHSAARNLKIEILEKKRRFVEASELKHEVNQLEKKKTQQPTVQKKNEDDQEEVEEEETTYTASQPTGEAEVSLIIPTTTYGKPALEHCLLSITEYCDTSGLELIVIDNASLDDTHDYLDELKEKGFLNCRVVTNAQNMGFAKSINQGLDKATGDYACIIDNDVEFNSDALSKLKQLMQGNPDYAVLGPATNKTLNPDQATRTIADDAPKLMRTEYLDSFCMMLRTDADLRMDEDYEMAFFEDIDLCFQARSEGHKVGIAPHVEVEHHFGTTTFSLDLDTESEQYWKNVSYFNEKWDIEVFSKEQLKSMSTFDQLLALDDIVNPLYPEEPVKDFFQELFTDELKTEIMKAQHDPETLCKLVHLFMVMNEREVMRKLEDRLENIELPASLIYQLVRFYYRRNIFSRCTHYLNRLKPQNETLRADLYRLAMLVENKDFDEAIPMLKELMDHAPANPMLYKLAGDIHKFSGNEEEAHSFYDLAEQINPFEFANQEKDAFGFKL